MTKDDVRQLVALAETWQAQVGEFVDLVKECAECANDFSEPGIAAVTFDMLLEEYEEKVDGSSVASWFCQRLPV